MFSSKSTVTSYLWNLISWLLSSLHTSTWTHPHFVSPVFISLVVFWNVKILVCFLHSDIRKYRSTVAPAVVSIQKQACASLSCEFLRQIGFATARTHGHLAAPQRDADVHGVRAGPDGCAGGPPRAVHIRRLLVPDPGECGRGPDQPAQQRLGVRAPFGPHFQILPAFWDGGPVTHQRSRPLMKSFRRALSYVTELHSACAAFLSIAFPCNLHRWRYLVMRRLYWFLRLPVVFRVHARLFPCGTLLLRSSSCTENVRETGIPLETLFEWWPVRRERSAARWLPG